MWLYLCKRIIEMHSGEIKAKTWLHLWWARFDIIIPIL
jgi:signal transduction histidine kinase